MRTRRIGHLAVLLVTCATVIHGTHGEASESSTDPAFGPTGTSTEFTSVEQTGNVRRRYFVTETSTADFVADRHLSGGRPRTIYVAGDDDLRSLLTLPSVADPNFITPRPIFCSPRPTRNPQPFVVGEPACDYLRATSSAVPSWYIDGHTRQPCVVRLQMAEILDVGKPHLWATAGTVLGGLANVYASGYEFSEFRLRVNSWKSEKIAIRQQGADMVQHFILGYGLTRYFLDNGTGSVEAGLSAFTYEFIAGEIFESFPQAGGISWRDVVVDVIASSIGVIDQHPDSPIRFWVGSQTDVKVSAPNEFDPYRVEIGLAVGRVAGLELVCSVQNWREPTPSPTDRDGPLNTSTGYFFANY